MKKHLFIKMHSKDLNTGTGVCVEVVLNVFCLVGDDF